ncbi:putative nuclease HARBI1 [Penaeus japonicus]|uniref:putative nuclease HARBI1 n=1 Tax=Penaeus japonicus TaxID=27405 RepID=UPI001C713264|nr:putative nuclease HARBI1 [Penaeus japonicus]
MLMQIFLFLSQFPSTENERLAVAADFEGYWNFPNCGGAIDGKHVRISSPAGSGSYYHNYKGFKSVILMAIVNANYEFMMVDVGRNGRMSDGGVFQTTTFCKKLHRHELNLPSADMNKEGLNFVFLGDDAFALHENLLKPFALRDLTIEKRIFNYRVSRARRVVENAFGILANRFRIFHTTINMSPNKIDVVVLACCILHNVLRQKNKGGYSPTTMVDREDIESRQLIPGSWRNEEQLTPLQANLNNTGQAGGKQNRDKYVTYFNTTGAVPWQNDMA